MNAGAQLGDGVTLGDGPPLVRSLADGTLALEVDLGVYALPAVLRACYRFSDRCYFFVRAQGTERATVYLQSKAGGVDDRWLGDWSNELLDQQVREELAREAGVLRELIAAQAFAEGNLLDADRDDGHPAPSSAGAGHPEET